ncbi:MAG: hypothetical protein PHZ00_07785 [Candidatus Peribacteraceae bacterium]|nr:hypothetical protein [Candidatus Peribacteraceae bacterium]
MKKMKKSPAATREDLRKLEGRLTKKFLTKADAKNFATKDDLKKFATKDDLKNHPTKQDMRDELQRELKKYATKEDLKQELQREMKKFATKEEIFRYFDMKTEQLQHDYAGIFSDRTMQLQEKTSDLQTRMVRVEKELHLDLVE